MNVKDYYQMMNVPTLEQEIRGVDTGTIQKCWDVNILCKDFLETNPSIDDYIEWREQNGLVASRRTLKRVGLDSVNEQISEWLAAAEVVLLERDIRPVCGHGRN